MFCATVIWTRSKFFSIILCKTAVFPNRQRKCMNADIREALKLRQCPGQKLDSFSITESLRFPTLSQTNCQLFPWKIASSVLLNICRSHSFLVVSMHIHAQTLAYNLCDQEAVVSQWTFSLSKYKLTWSFNSILRGFPTINLYDFKVVTIGTSRDQYHVYLKSYTVQNHQK